MKIRIPLFSFIILFFILLSACGSSINGKYSTNSTHSAIAASTTRLPQFNTTVTSVSTTQTINTNTNCPKPGTGRAAIMPSIHLDNDQNIVYLSNSIDGKSGPSGGGLFFLKRYDVKTKATSVILNLYGNTFETAQLSNSGQWVLFTSQVHNNSEIQLVRLDGQYLQTLYCAPTGQQIDSTHTTGIQWSPDQKQIIFSQSASPSSPQSIYLLQVGNGNVQRELTTRVTDPQFLPRTWLDNQRVFITDISGANVRLLDTSKGSDQNYNSMQRIIGPHDSILDFDSSYDASTLFISSYFHQGPTNQCLISSNGINSNTGLKFIKCATLPVNGLRMIDKSSSRLLLAVNDGNFKNPKNGLWKINTDGTNLIQLTNFHYGLSDTLCPFTQYSWSNFSRDGSFYTDYTSFGSLNGGPLTPYTTNFNIRLVGWTTM
jgi:eukaryotic-like serine/threonine-protein kinase